MLTTLGQVAVGGAVGAAARYLTGVAAIRMIGPGFPWATVFVNVAGSVAMGALVVILGHLSANRWAPFLMTGVLGGFTTFSAFSLDAVTIFERGQTLAAAGYVAGSVALSVGGLVVGMALARAAFA